MAGATALQNAAPIYTCAVAIPSEQRAEAEVALNEFCAQHSSTVGADRLNYTYQFEANAAVLIQQRPGFMKPDELVSKPIAKFRYSEARNLWTLYWFDPNGKWHRVSNVENKKDIRVLLQVVVTDPLGVFWS